MKYLTVLALTFVLVGCSDYVPMSAAEGQAFKACLDKDMVPEFKETSSARALSCQRK